MSCCSTNGTCSTTETATVDPAAVTTVFTVAGMTCGHCEQAVGKAVGALEGVRAVRVDVRNGLVSVDSAAGLDDSAVRAAVDEAGYELTGRA
ncbi:MULTISPECIES: cation transporter [Kitasatospora]|uniref:Putative metal transporter ATPase n=1 Tax=Kitasatospora setae (strain ATCC 33774 / DSM 43861 / JCM 3304 / KCC A-0304 / NBRC 14216 / KM-6054) TaxID=452652 RepID=E4NDY3_KITSK|nr:MULTISPECIES: cation transporter [Kitasatospora]BAJ29414.1 putative metal transporter ATPase [Kitasatospora setae KM-6054]